MNVFPVNSGAPLSKNYSANQQVAVTAEQATAFEASLDGASEAVHENLSQDQSDASMPQESWDVFWKGFNQSIFDHNRRQFAYYDQKRREIDYGNKP